MEKDIKETIKVVCSIENIRYYKEESGWGIVLASIDKIKKGKPKTNKNGLLVLRGIMPKPIQGNMYNVIAEYCPDPKWGEQYNVFSFFSTVEFGENDKKAQKKFLASIFTPYQVANMYKALDDPFEALKNERTTELVKVHGCGIKTAINWVKRFKDNFCMGKIFVELDEYNLTNNMIKKLLRRYNDSPELVIEKVRNNPYVLCTEVDGIGWKTADKLALSGGIEEFSPKRVAAYIFYYLEQSGQNGFSWITPDEMMGALLDIFGEEIPDKNISEAIQSLGEKLWWDEEKTKIGLRKYFSIEEKIAKELIRIRDAESKIQFSNFEDTISRLEYKQGWKFTDEQKNGIKVGLDNNITVIQGYAGTGKSSLVSAIIEVLRKYSYVQCALSGRASARMSEITGEEGFTIHRLLEYPKGPKEKQEFKKNDENPLEYDIYILDEISMVDAFLFYYLLRAIPDGAKLICLGDPGQLESIGCGNIAHDMIHSSEIPTVSLTQIHRQASASAIITESIKIRKGQQIIEKEWAGEETRGELQDLHLKCFSDSSNTYYEIMKGFSFLMSKEDFNILDCQIIVPIKNRGMACTYEINNAVQELYNPLQDGMREVIQYSEGRAYSLRAGDKVINVKNAYNIEPSIYNGNIGIIRGFEIMQPREDNDLTEETEVMIIDFIGIGTVMLPKKLWANIELGYAITGHKSQGSQWEQIIFGIDFSSYSLLTRELLYTGITRAKKECYLIAQTNALRMAVCKEGVNEKQTHLQQCLYDIAHPKIRF